MTNRHSPYQELDTVRPDRTLTRVILRWTIYAAFVIVAIGLVSGAAGWISGWASEPGRVTGVDNVRAQWQFAYDYDADLRAIAQQVCNAEVMVENATSDAALEQRQSQVLAYQNNYERVRSEYDGRLRDAFRAKYVAPDDVPDKAPTLVDMKATVCTQQ